jgi:hypothetical protein
MHRLFPRLITPIERNPQRPIPQTAQTMKLKAPQKNVKRVTRSVSFPKEVFGYVKDQAAELDRSVNWVLNDLVKKHLKNSAK